MARGIFITGTDTGVGKTLAACALIHALRVRGVRAHPFKPVAAGAVMRSGRWVNEDTLALMAAAELDEAAADAVTPVLLREALAPAHRRRARGPHDFARGDSRRVRPHRNRRTVRRSRRGRRVSRAVGS